MGRFAYVNGAFVPHAKAQVHIEDRGYQFADGVYDVVPVFDGHIFNKSIHLDRLENSLKSLAISLPVSRPVLEMLAEEIKRKNNLIRGMVYFQVTRGVAPRDHKFPKFSIPSLIMTTKQVRSPSDEALEKGVEVISCPDERWARVDIKSLSLLPNVLAKQLAVEKGAFEAWLLDSDGSVTEGTSTTAWIVMKDGTLVTRDLSPKVLTGMTRKTVLEILKKEGMTVEERPFLLKEALQAQEAFLTSASNYGMPVTKIDGQKIGTGTMGPVVKKIRALYEERIRASIAEIKNN